MYEYEIRNAIARGSDPRILALNRSALDYVQTELRGDLRLLNAFRRNSRSGIAIRIRRK